MNILIADDDQMQRILLSETLERWGHNVIGVENGDEAMDVLMDNPSNFFDLIITDGQMPIMNGLELIQALKGDGETPALADFKDIPIVMVSGSKGLEKPAREAGAVAFIAKPYTSTELKRVLQEIFADERSLA